MSTNQSILFDPELDERKLDKEVSQIDSQLEGVGQDVPVNFDAEEMDGLSPAGMGRGGGAGGGFGGAAAGASLASRIPKPVAGVAASAALPIALVGGVGMGILSAMNSASARMQTSNKLFGIAVDNFFREPGNVFDKHVTRPLADALLDMSIGFSDNLRNSPFWNAIKDPQTAANIAQMEEGPEFPDNFWPEGPVAPWETEGGFWPTGPTPPWETGDGFFPDGPTPPWETGGGFWPAGPKFPDNFWPDVKLAGWVRTLTEPSDTTDTFDPTDSGTEGGPGEFRGGGSNTTGGGGGGFMESLQGGGRVTRSGVAEVHRGELVADPQRLASEIGAAISTASGGRTNVSMDTSSMERKLDELNRNVRRLANSLSTEAVGPEEMARLVSNGMDHHVADTNKRV